MNRKQLDPTPIRYRSPTFKSFVSLTVMMYSEVGNAAQSLFNQIKQNDGVISDEVLLGFLSFNIFFNYLFFLSFILFHVSLTFLFKKTTSEAISILEKSRLIHCISPSGRSFYTVLVFFYTYLFDSLVMFFRLRVNQKNIFVILIFVPVRLSYLRL